MHLYILTNHVKDNGSRCCKTESYRCKCKLLHYCVIVNGVATVETVQRRPIVRLGIDTLITNVLVLRVKFVSIS